MGGRIRSGPTSTTDRSAQHKTQDWLLFSHLFKHHVPPLLPTSFCAPPGRSGRVRRRRGGRVGTVPGGTAAGRCDRRPRVEPCHTARRKCGAQSRGPCSHVYIYSEGGRGVIKVTNVSQPSGHIRPSPSSSSTPPYPSAYWVLLLNPHLSPLWVLLLLTEATVCRRHGARGEALSAFGAPPLRRGPLRLRRIGSGTGGCASRRRIQLRASPVLRTEQGGGMGRHGTSRFADQPATQRTEART